MEKDLSRGSYVYTELFCILHCFKLYLFSPFLLFCYPYVLLQFFERFLLIFFYSLINIQW